MKKLISLCLTVLLVIALTACGSGSNPDSGLLTTSMNFNFGLSKALGEGGSELKEAMLGDGSLESIAQDMDELHQKALADQHSVQPLATVGGI